MNQPPTHTPELADIAGLKRHPKNYKRHPPEQLAHIKASLVEHGFYRNVVVARDSTILAGHGVVEAATELGAAQVPVIRLDIDPMDARALKVVAGDNEIARLGETDNGLLAELLKEIAASAPKALVGTGFDDAALKKLLAAHTAEGNPYTWKLQTPVYEPKLAAAPPIAKLLDETRTAKLVADVKAEGLPADVEAFLISAAQRHTVFDFENIAEYYAHASPEVQKLMEDSALVIVDFQRAIELGYVEVADGIRELIKAGG